MKRFGVKTKLILPLIALAIAVVGIAHWKLASVAEEQAVAATVQAADTLTSQIRAMRGYYAKNVISPAKKTGMKISHEHTDDTGTLPLPATMVHEINRKMADREGFNVRLYSDHPFPWRAGKDGGPQDDFENEAIAFLRANPDQTFHRTESLNGVPSVRFASADLMVAQGCVDCHNTRADSPKTDWKLGDVRGVLTVTAPLTEAHAAATAAANETSMLLGATLGIGVLVVALIATWSVVRPLRKMAEASHQFADGNTDTQIDVTGGDEVGQLADSLRTMRRAMTEVTTEVSALADLASHGDFSRRADTDRFSGVYHDMLSGVNRNLDAFAKQPTRQSV